MNRIVKRLAVPLSAAAVLGTAGFAYMATSTVSPMNAGVGAGTISGYQVTNVHYNIVDNVNTTGHTYIQTVSFTLSPDNATQARAWITDDSGAVVGQYYSCNEASGTWTCQNQATGFEPYYYAPTVNARHLHVSASQ